jgi:phospholipid-binding lipoprotein MlaA
MVRAEKQPDDFGLTLRYDGAPTGPYLMLPFFGPSMVGGALGRVADGAMDPMS